MKIKYFILFSLNGDDICTEIVKRAAAGFVYSEAVARYFFNFVRLEGLWQLIIGML